MKQLDFQDSELYTLSCEKKINYKNLTITEIDNYQIKANNNNLESIYLLGCYYYEKKEKFKAIKYWEKGDKLKHGPCINNLGKHYHFEDKYDIAISYWEKGTTLNEGSCFHNIGNYHLLNSINYDNDEIFRRFSNIKAIEYYNKAAQLGIFSLDFDENGDKLEYI